MGKDIYRKRLKIPMNKEVLAFLSSLNDDLWIAEEDIVGTEVHDIMLHEQGILTKEEISQILKSLEKIKKKLINSTLVLNESFEDIHPFIEQSVIEEIGMEIGGKIHTGRSRNDQVAVDLRLKIRKELNQLSGGLFELCEVLMDLSERSQHVLMPLYTHFQKAQLGSFSHYLNTYLEQILRSLERIEEIYKRVNANPLGACAIGGTNIDIDRKITMELLGFESIVFNSIDAVSSKDYLMETMQCLALMALQFSRIDEDLLVWSTKEFDFIEVDEQYCSVSSVMPQKKNPDTLELIRSGCSNVITNSFNCAMIIKSIPTAYFRDFQDLKPLLKDSFDRIHAIGALLKGIFSSLIIKEQNMRLAIQNSNILALDVAEFLVRQYNIPFRLSHEIIARLSRGERQGLNIYNKIELEKMIQDVTKKNLTLPDDFEELFKDPEKCLEKRMSMGSPSRSEIKNNLILIREKKEKLSEAHGKRMNKLKKAESLLSNKIEELS